MKLTRVISFVSVLLLSSTQLFAQPPLPSFPGAPKAPAQAAPQPPANPIEEIKAQVRKVILSSVAPYPDDILVLVFEVSQRPDLVVQEKPHPTDKNFNESAATLYSRFPSVFRNLQQHPLSTAILGQIVQEDPEGAWVDIDKYRREQGLAPNAAQQTTQSGSNNALTTSQIASAPRPTTGQPVNYGSNTTHNTTNNTYNYNSGSSSNSSSSGSSSSSDEGDSSHSSSSSSGEDSSSDSSSSSSTSELTDSINSYNETLTETNQQLSDLNTNIDETQAKADEVETQVQEREAKLEGITSSEEFSALKEGNVDSSALTEKFGDSKNFEQMQSKSPFGSSGFSGSSSNGFTGFNSQFGRQGSAQQSRQAFTSRSMGSNQFQSRMSLGNKSMSRGFGRSEGSLQKNRGRGGGMPAFSGRGGNRGGGRMGAPSRGGGGRGPGGPGRR